jgi:hypothetical protein
MGDGRIFLKTRCDASFEKDLSNEPNFDRIHLAGQYLSGVIIYIWKSLLSEDQTSEVDCAIWWRLLPEGSFGRGGPMD